MIHVLPLSTSYNSTSVLLYVKLCRCSFKKTILNHVCPTKYQHFARQSKIHVCSRTVVNFSVITLQTFLVYFIHLQDASLWY